MIDSLEKTFNSRAHRVATYDISTLTYLTADARVVFKLECIGLIETSHFIEPFELNDT